MTPDPDPDPDLPPDPVRDLLLPVRRMTDPAMVIESSDLVTNLERESKPEVLMAVPLTGSRSRINLNEISASFSSFSLAVVFLIIMK